jgi:GalNAc-alpha-(1->4)-GalNAc-alpha-(1->3)-diNAcBac-PP-undecaprenol alpha-1,4-N-acetyl-D-galactosaminyltransferase
MLKILLMVSSMGSGGAERVAATLANQWAFKGYSVTLMPTFSGRGACFYNLSNKVRIVYLADLAPKKSNVFFSQLVRLKALRKFIHKESPDVIVSFLSNVNIAAVLSSFGLNIPTIICDRTDPFSTPINFWMKVAARITYPFAQALVVQTAAVEYKYRKSFFSNKHISVIGNPIPTNIFDNKKVPTLKIKIILGVGRLVEQKQFDVLIRVFSGLAKNYPEWGLRIVGEGSLGEDLWKQACVLKMQNHIKILKPTRDISKLFSEASIFVLTSKYEGFPNAMLEAMAMGLPCLAFNCPSGPSDLSGNGRFAALVPLGDEDHLSHKLQELMDSFNSRVSLGKKGRLHVRSNYSSNRILCEWDNLFKALGLSVTHE